MNTVRSKLVQIVMCQVYIVSKAANVINKTSLLYSLWSFFVLWGRAAVNLIAVQLVHQLGP